MTEPLTELPEPVTDVYYWWPSGGVNKTDGKISFASETRGTTILPLVMDDQAQILAHATPYAITLVVSGEETRKSASGYQSDKLETYAREDWGYEGALLNLPYGTDEAFLALARKHPDVESILFVNDRPHLRRYMAKFRLLDKAYAAKIQAIVAEGQDEYYEHYAKKYVTCYNACGWLDVALGYLRKGRVETPWYALNAAWYLARATLMVGPRKLFWFGVDRVYNKPTDDPVKLARIAHIRTVLGPELLGES